jgi:hypothetical protein
VAFVAATWPWQTLHSLVLRFVQAQGELWAQLPHVATGTALRISELKTDPHEVRGHQSPRA